MIKLNLGKLIISRMKFLDDAQKLKISDIKKLGGSYNG